MDGTWDRSDVSRLVFAAHSRCDRLALDINDRLIRTLFSVAVNELIASQPKKFKDIIYDEVVKAASPLALSMSPLAMTFFDALIDEDEIRKKNNTRMRFLAGGNEHNTK